MAVAHDADLHIKPPRLSNFLICVHLFFRKCTALRYTHSWPDLGTPNVVVVACMNNIHKLSLHWAHNPISWGDNPRGSVILSRLYYNTGRGF